MYNNKYFLFFFTFFLSIVFFNKIYPQVYNGNLLITTQSEIDNFNYTAVNGDLIIFEQTPNNITNFDGLSELTSVGGIFGIYNTTITNVDALINLVNIAGVHESQLDINGNTELVNLDGLVNLTTVSWLTIRNNSSLTNVDGLSGLQGIGENIIGSTLEIENNDALTNINGLSGVIVFGDDPFGYVSIRFNDALTEFCGLNTLLSNNTPAVVLISGNAVNPSVQDIINGGPCPPSNQPPVAVCRDVTVFADGNGEADVAPEEVNNGSSDPDNDPLTFSLNPPGPYTVGTTQVVLTVSDGQATSTCNAVITVDEPAVILATNSVWLEASADVLSGNVVVNNVSNGPTLDSGVELSVGIGSTTPQGYSLKANRIRVKPGANVKSDVYYNSLTNNGTITGSINTPLYLPVYSSLPPFQEGAVGTQNVTVPINGSVTLSAGNYKDIVVRSNGNLLLSGGGTFSVNSIKLNYKAKLYFDAPARILIKNKFDSDLNCLVGPKDGSGINASDIILYVAGINGSSGSLSALPKAAQVGLNNVIKANFYVQNGTLWLRGSSEATGSFIGKDILVGLNVKISEDNAFSSSTLAKSGRSIPIEEASISSHVPEKFELSQNYPNPFNPITKINFSIPAAGYVSLRIYDVMGSEVAVLVDEIKSGGSYIVEFDGSKLTSGVYFYKIQAGQFVQTKKLVLLK